MLNYIMGTMFSVANNALSRAPVNKILNIQNGQARLVTYTSEHKVDLMFKCLEWAGTLGYSYVIS